jgi:kynurenine formamidase
LSQQFSLEEYARDPHSGTHIDAPAYAFEGAKNVAGFGLERFNRDAALLDLSRKKPGEPIDDEDLEAAEESAGLALREGEAVILHTCSAEAPLVGRGNVYLSQNGAEYLEFKSVSLVGVDSASIDNVESTELVAHRTLLSKEILVLEGLRNLKAIDSSRFRLVTFPLRLNGATAPVRAVAILE